MRVWLLILCWVVALGGVAQGQVRLRVVDDAGGLVLLGIAADGSALPSAWAQLQLVRSEAGACGKPEVLRELEPAAAVAAPEVLVEDRLPASGITYRYALRPVDAAGRALADLDHVPTARAHAAKGEAVALRGTLTYLGNRTFALEGCGSGCWDACDAVTPEDFGVGLVRMLDWSASGAALDVTAIWNDDPDAPSCFAAVTSVEASPACDALPNHTTSWSALKQSYR